jgi:hypothetical protein
MNRQNITDQTYFCDASRNFRFFIFCRDKQFLYPRNPDIEHSTVTRLYSMCTSLRVGSLSTLTKKKIKFSSYSEWSSCKAIYDERPPHIWGNICAFFIQALNTCTRSTGPCLVLQHYDMPMYLYASSLCHAKYLSSSC